MKYIWPSRVQRVTDKSRKYSNLEMPVGIVGRVKRGLNRIVQINRSAPFFIKSESVDPPISLAIFVEIQNHNHILKQKCGRSKLNW